jgi:hypothetical protein
VWTGLKWLRIGASSESSVNTVVNIRLPQQAEDCLATWADGRCSTVWSQSLCLIQILLQYIKFCLLSLMKIGFLVPGVTLCVEAKWRTYTSLLSHKRVSLRKAGVSCSNEE